MNGAHGVPVRGLRWALLLASIVPLAWLWVATEAGLWLVLLGAVVVAALLSLARSLLMERGPDATTVVKPVDCEQS